MDKTQLVWNEILNGEKRALIRQSEIAEKLGISASTVNGALRIPRRVGAVEVHHRGFLLTDYRKLMTVWAVHRNLEKDILASLSVNLPVQEIEQTLHGRVLYTGCTQYKILCGGTPADYDKIYAYASTDDIHEIKHTLSPHVVRDASNVVLLDLPQVISGVSPRMLWVDLWNIPDWWASYTRRYLDEDLERGEV